MNEACMFDILALAEEDLKRVLARASARSLAKLVAAYPRAVGKTFLEVLHASLSAPAYEFLEEEMSAMRLPSYPEIRQAESELMQIIHEEHLEDRVFSSQLATPLPR